MKANGFEEQFCAQRGAADVRVERGQGSGVVPISAAPRQLAAALREQLERMDGGRSVRERCVISSGCPGLDRLLPSGGLVRGSLVECLGESWHAGGAGTVAMLLACQAARAGGALVVLDPQHWFYPPAAAVLGVDLARLVVVRAWQRSDQCWALDQALRCPAVAAVWAPMEELDERDFRRLQLAAEAGQGLGLLIRSHRVGQQPSWSDLRLWISPQALPPQQLSAGRRLRIQVARCRQGRGGGSVEVEIDQRAGVWWQVSSHHEASTVCPTAPLAHSAAGGRSA